MNTAALNSGGGPLAVWVKLKSSALVGTRAGSQHPSFWSALLTNDKRRTVPTVRVPLTFSLSLMVSECP